MNLLQQVKAALKWKRSAADTAAKLGISIEKYLELKKIYTYNINISSSSIPRPIG